mmetsp:Transcript_33597/g.77501  ORF Transcript_33597/g.77501 Transcript_33597/m.77501 type:complete len:540 (-) Transcript_33597:170-1789(-)|eukprot:CAMPEP_0113302132 /NCGR_PEP_ID=MMETSP0010_2-20120614/3070_1 /TAXON_ID=216773 ORGANISM="Corethron hystrix, Strain 308" /NCGR_SAMPLE_ID=MMETSP0010_2 /ASSEMBLY_ACC=CAM_ASM_000155 /LENGTH=539 /DNA_ID=CAMNT_0000155867 /DNA_START=98 /DNA_END=1717 /DNA_ORIENTATION=- /assembly_acc=CAM_ASM_000155
MFFKSKNREGKQRQLLIARTVDGIKLAATSRDAETALQEACIAFRHDDEERHDEEVESGAATALYKQLALYLHTNGSDKDIQLITLALSMVYKCSKATRVSSFGDIGSGLLTVLSQVIERTLNGTIDDEFMALTHAARTLLLLSQVNELKTELVKHDGLVKGLVNIMGNRDIEDARVDAMHSIIFLMFEDDNVVTMARVPGLIEMLTEVAIHREEEDQIRRWSGAAMWNLACCPANKVMMASRPTCLRAILFLMKSTCLVTVGYAVSTVRQLATEEDNKSSMVNYNNGSLLRAIVYIATRDDIHMEITRKSVHSLHYLVSHITAVDACKHSPLSEKNTGLLVTLTSLVIDSPDEEIREAALSGLTTIAIALCDGMCQFETLLQCLVNLLKSGRIEPTTMSLAALRKISVKAENHFSMVNCLGLLETLGEFIVHNIEIGHPERIENAMALDVLLSLTTDDVCCVVVADSDAVLGALEQVLIIRADLKIQECAFKIIGNFANSPDSRVKTSKHKGLMYATLHKSKEDPTLRESFKLLAADM